MKLKEYLNSLGHDWEVEVFDAIIDIQAPYYTSQEMVFDEYLEEDKDLVKLENWVRDFEIVKLYPQGVALNIYEYFEHNVDKAIEIADKYYGRKLNDNIMCSIVDMIYATLSQGYYEFAKIVVETLKL